MSRGARDMVKQIWSARRPKEQLRLSIVVAAALWWIALALLSRLSWSALQLEWDLPASVAILAFFPLCILAGALPVLLFPLRWRACAARRLRGGRKSANLAVPVGAGNVADCRMAPAPAPLPGSKFRGSHK